MTVSIAKCLGTRMIDTLIVGPQHEEEEEEEGYATVNACFPGQTALVVANKMLIMTVSTASSRQAEEHTVNRCVSLVKHLLLWSIK